MAKLKDCKRIVVKVGTSTLTHESGSLNIRRMEGIVRILSDFKNSGHEIVLVSSGAVSAGIAKTKLGRRPASVMEKQAMAAVGQSELMKVYEHYFSDFGHPVGQILITKDELDREKVFDNARSTFNTLIKMGCIPIVNENDSVSYDEIEFGDNDTLSACVALICHADALIIFSDIDGLYDSDPRKNKNARLIEHVAEIDDTILACAGGVGSDRGTGGMLTKLNAAQIATAAGIPMQILNGRDPRVLYRVIEGEHVGTYFEAKEKM